MIKRNIAVFVVAGIVLGGGALALAQGQPDRPTTDPGAAQAPDDRRAELQARREAARKCLQDAGEDQAKRQQCREQFKAGKGKGGKGKGGGALRRAVHGDLVVRGEDGKYEKVTFDRGKLGPSTDGAKIVIERPDGQNVTLQLTPETRYHGVQDAGQLRKGEGVMATSRDGKALSVAQRGPKKPGPGNRSRGGNKLGPPGVPND